MAGPRPQDLPGGVAPAPTVERFLRLAAEKQYLEMGYVFGTRDGPIALRDPAASVERRMYLLANILENERFAIRDQAPIPGRTGEAVQLNVELTQRGRAVVVPFVVVRHEGRWLVEIVDVQKITAGA